ncbi:hypothetical protein GCM10020001_078920 [Nonomuraea salmonea]
MLKRLAQAERGGPVAGDALGEVDDVVVARPGQGVVAEVFEPGGDVFRAPVEEAGQRAGGGAGHGQGGLGELQAGQRQPAQGLHHGETVAQALGEGVEAPGPGRGDGVGPVREDAPKPVLV